MSSFKKASILLFPILLLISCNQGNGKEYQRMAMRGIIQWKEAIESDKPDYKFKYDCCRYYYLTDYSENGIVFFFSIQATSYVSEKECALISDEVFYDYEANTINFHYEFNTASARWWIKSNEYHGGTGLIYLDNLN